HKSGNLWHSIRISVLDRFLHGECKMQKPRNAVLAAIVIIAPTVTWAQPTSGESRKLSADQVAFYEVPLACPAARGLGCGSAAKPVLSSLEKRKTIDEAWLDRAGT